AEAVAQLRQPAAAPHPAAVDRVDEGADEEAEDEEAPEGPAFGEGAGGDGGGGVHEDHHEQEPDDGGAVVGGPTLARGEEEADLAEESPAAVALDGGADGGHLVKRRQA